MTNTIPPTPTPNPTPDDERRDELLAVLVALGVLGAVFFFSLGGSPNRRRLAEIVGLSSSETERLAEGDLDSDDIRDGDPTIGQTFGSTVRSGADRLNGLSAAVTGAGQGSLEGDLEDEGVANRGRARWQLFPFLFAGGAASGDAGVDTDSNADGADATDGLALEETDAQADGDALDGTEPSPVDAGVADGDGDAEPTDEEAIADADAPPETDADAEPAPELATETPVDRFPDVPDDYWALPFIEGLREQEIATGFVTGDFEPDSPISRAQFASQLARAFPAEGSLPVDYTDVTQDHPQYDAISEVTQSGFMTGYDVGDFRPNNNVSRMEVLLSLVSGLTPNKPDDAVALLKSVYEDAEQIPAWAADAIAAATDAKMAVSRDSDAKTFDPDLPATRGEAAAMLYQALFYQGKAPALDSNHVFTP